MSAFSRLYTKIQKSARSAFNRLPVGESQRLYILTLAIGLVCGLAAVCFHLLLDILQNSIIYRAADTTSWVRFPLVVVIPALGGLAAGAGLYFLVPEARGSGIPQVKAAFMLHGGMIPGKVVFGKMFLSSFNIGTGASLGREGPTVQISAAIASWLGRMFRLSKERLESLIPIGAAAGLAAAFNTPIAAVTFTLEEIIGDGAARPLGSIVIAAVISSVVQRSILGEHPLFSVPAYHLGSAVELIFYVLLGLAGGCISAGFSEGLLRLRRRFKSEQRIPQWTTPAVGGLMLGVIGALALALTGSSSIFGVGYAQLAVVLKSGLPLQILVILCLGKFAATIISYSSGSSGGIFGPSLYIGGMLGGIVGLLARYVLPAYHIEPGAFALVGMGAIFAGVVRAPVTSIVMIFEMTNNYSIILPLMIANIISYSLARRISPLPIYDALLMQDGIHLRQSEFYLLRKYPVHRVMTQSVVTLPANLTAEDAKTLIDIMAEHHRAYPIVSADGVLQGMCTVKELKLAIMEGEGRKPLTGLFPFADGSTVTADDTLEGAAMLMRERNMTHVPVVEEGDRPKLAGILTMHDVAKVVFVER